MYKKTISVLLCLLFALTILYPAGALITACLGYRFELLSVSAFAVTMALLSLCTVVLNLVHKNTIENKTIQVLLAVITPLSLINAVFYISDCSQIWVIASVIVSAICCCILSVKHGRPALLKIAALALSGMMVLPLRFLSVLGNLTQDTVVQTVESPSGEYYAQVIDNDQGALGGATLVYVYENSRVDAFLFKIEKKPQRIYLGRWGEFENMQIYWKGDGCLVINSDEYEIE